MTIILGIAAFCHDAAACIIADGEIVSAAQEERFTRIKHDQSFPSQAIAFCIETNGYRPAEIDHVVFYDKPLLKFNRLIQTYLAFAPKGFESFATATPLYIHLSQQFSSSSARKRAFWLSMNNLLTLISKISSSKSIRKFLNKMLKFDPTVNHSFVAEIIDEISSADTNVVALAAAKDYLRVIRLAHACCKSEQTTFINFFQPCLSWGDKPMTPTEQEYLKNSPPMGGVQRKFQEFVMSKPQPDYFHDLSDIFDTVQQQVFIDTGHLNPDGNLIVAERMADQLAIQLK